MESSGGACVVCGVKRDKGMVGDEVWDYGDGMATLTGVRIVCRDCDAVTHIGSTSGRGYLEAARDHMARINGISTDEANVLIDVAFREWQGRSRLPWTVSVSADLLARYPELAVLRRVGPARPTDPL